MRPSCGDVSHHVKSRGKVHRCAWCDQLIVVGERYAKWLFYDYGERFPIHAHAECHAAWRKEADRDGGIHETSGGNERPGREEGGEA